MRAVDCCGMRLQPKYTSVCQRTNILFLLAGSLSIIYNMYCCTYIIGTGVINRSRRLRSFFSLNCQDEIIKIKIIVLVLWSRLHFLLTLAFIAVLWKPCVCCNNGLLSCNIVETSAARLFLKIWEMALLTATRVQLNEKWSFIATQRSFFISDAPAPR